MSKRNIILSILLPILLIVLIIIFYNYKEEPNITINIPENKNIISKENIIINDTVNEIPNSISIEHTIDTFTNPNNQVTKIEKSITTREYNDRSSTTSGKAISLGSIGSIGNDLDLSRNSNNSNDNVYRDSSVSTQEGIDAAEVDVMVNRAKLDLKDKLEKDLKKANTSLELIVLEKEKELKKSLDISITETLDKANAFASKSVELSSAQSDSLINTKYDTITVRLKEETTSITESLTSLSTKLSKETGALKDSISKETSLLESSIEDTSSTALKNNKAVRTIVKEEDEKLKEDIKEKTDDNKDLIREQEELLIKHQASLNSINNDLTSSINKLINTSDSLLFNIKALEQNLTQQSKMFNITIENQNQTLTTNLDNSITTLEDKIVTLSASIEDKLKEHTESLTTLVDKDFLDKQLSDINDSTRRTGEVFFTYLEECPRYTYPVSSDTYIPNTSPLSGIVNTLPTSEGVFLRANSLDTYVGLVQEDRLDIALTENMIVIKNLSLTLCIHE